MSPLRATVSPLEPAALRRVGYGQLAGWLFISAALLAVPGTLLTGEASLWPNYLATALGLVSGLVCLRLPWERYRNSAFHAVAIVATLEIAVVIRVVDPLYACFYFLVAVYVAYIYPNWEEIVPHVVFLSFVLLLPAVYDPDSLRETVRYALFAAPVLALAAGMVGYLRGLVERRARQYARLAGETSAIASRIQNSLGHGTEPAPLPQASGRTR